jgi:hypothetical protein
MDGSKISFLRRADGATSTIVKLGVLAVVVAAVWAGLRAQAPAKATAVPGPIAANSIASISPRPAPACCGYPFPRKTDAEIADGDVHRALYEDSRIMFLEVINPPLLDVHMHGHPYTSVFAHDSTTGPKIPDAPSNVGDTRLDKSSPYNDMGSGEGKAPEGMMWPTCTDSAPQAPHRPYNTHMAPNHFYRLEFLRLDGDDFAAHWKEWYPAATAPGKPVKDLTPGPTLGQKFSDAWPYPIAYDEIQAAPNNYKLLFEDEKLRLVEVMIRPGETTPMNGIPYSAVLAFNTVNTVSRSDSAVTDTMMDPSSALNGQGSGEGKAPSLYNLKVPLCMTMTARAPHAIHNGLPVPLHYYQIEYKRLDGDGLLAHWKEWYPFMMYMQYMRAPAAN